MHKKIFIIGVDKFGTALAKQLVSQGFEVFVLDPLEPSKKSAIEGFIHVKSLEQALERADAILNFFPDKNLMNTRFCSPDTAYLLQGKALLNIHTARTSDPASARSMGHWAANERVEYLEVLLDTQKDVWDDCTRLICSGNKAAFFLLVGLCESLGTRASYLGTDTGDVLAQVS